MLKYRFKRRVAVANQHAKCKIAFKTENESWQGTNQPVVIPISIHTAFHHGLYGGMKMDALISTVKNHIRGEMTILLTEGAHRHVHALSMGSRALAERILTHEAHLLCDRYRPLFAGYKVVFWYGGILGDPLFPLMQKEVQRLIAKDPQLSRSLDQDVQDSYTPERRTLFPNSNLYLECAKKDVLEYLAYQLLFTSRSYGYQFYPGRDYCSSYCLQALHPNAMQSINVFLSIEKKRALEDQMQQV